MPYSSRKQEAYLHIHYPEMVAKWDREIKRRNIFAIISKKRKKNGQTPYTA